MTGLATLSVASISLITVLLFEHLSKALIEKVSLFQAAECWAAQEAQYYRAPKQRKGESPVSDQDDGICKESAVGGNGGFGGALSGW
jgi:hypothetical protein